MLKNWVGLLVSGDKSRVAATSHQFGREVARLVGDECTYEDHAVILGVDNAGGRPVNYSKMKARLGKALIKHRRLLKLRKRGVRTLQPSRLTVMGAIGYSA